MPNDNGHQLKLNWESSPSEAKGLVSLYRFFRSRNPNGIESIRNMSDFLRFGNSCVDSINAWEQNYAVLRDSVSAGNREYIDSAVFLNNTLYYYWLQAVWNNFGSTKIAGKWNNVGVKEENIKFNVSNAYPNPFNATTTINYTIPEGTNIELVVYDINGRKVKTLDCGWKDGGSYRSNWDGTDKNGRNVGNGVYFYRIHSGKYIKYGKIGFVK